MNLSKLFELQKGLDAPYSHVEDRLSKDILWLMEELGELAREWRGHKYRRADQTPNVVHKGTCDKCDYHIVRRLGVEHGIRSDGSVCDCWYGLKAQNPLLEEYTDCLSIILSLGLHRNMQDKSIDFIKLHGRKCPDVVSQLLRLSSSVADLWVYEGLKYNILYWEIIGTFINLGEMLGFTWEQIEENYTAKAKANATRNC